MTRPVLLVAAGILVACARQAPRPEAAAPSGLPNLSLVKQQVVQYRTSGRWEAEIARVADECLRAAREASRSTARPAVVFDIDETLLSNWPYLMEYDFARVPSLFAPWAERSECPANEAVRRFYATMRDAGVATFVITGRREALRKVTITNLEREGIAGWAGIAFRAPDDHEASIVPFKSGERARIESNGYTIVANIGDQDSDLVGGHALHMCKLPNPAYFIP